MEEEELKELYTEAKREAMDLFKKKAVGNIAEDFVKELKDKMRDIYQQVKDENERESS